MEQGRNWLLRYKKGGRKYTATHRVHTHRLLCVSGHKGSPARLAAGMLRKQWAQELEWKAMEELVGPGG